VPTLWELAGQLSEQDAQLAEAHTATQELEAALAYLAQQTAERDAAHAAEIQRQQAAYSCLRCQARDVQAQLTAAYEAVVALETQITQERTAGAALTARHRGEVAVLEAEAAEARHREQAAREEVRRLRRTAADEERRASEAEACSAQLRAEAREALEEAAALRSEAAAVSEAATASEAGTAAVAAPVAGQEAAVGAAAQGCSSGCVQRRLSFSPAGRDASPKRAAAQSTARACRAGVAPAAPRVSAAEVQRQRLLACIEGAKRRFQEAAEAQAA